METASTEVTSIRRRNNVEKSTKRTHRYFVDFESRIQVEISTSNWCHGFHVDLPFKIYVISTNFPRGISTSNRWRIDEDVSIVLTSVHLAFRTLGLNLPLSDIALVPHISLSRSTFGVRHSREASQSNYGRLNANVTSIESWLRSHS